MLDLALAAALGVVASPTDPPSQAIVVTSQAWGSQRATLRRFRHDGQGWVQVGRPITAWIGVNGFVRAERRHQNTGTTPAGVFAVPSAFGRVVDPRLRLPYQRVTASSYWPYDPRDPRTYNVLQSRRAGSARWRDDGQWSERLIDYGRQYRLAAVIGYNLPRGIYTAPSGERRAASPAQVHKGGGIFLHVTRGRPTAGCVAIAWPAMRQVAGWLNPAANPQIVMGPRSFTRDWRARVA